MVAGSDRPEAIDPGSTRKLLQLLSSLRNSPAGDLIYRQVEAILDEITANLDAAAHFRTIHLVNPQHQQPVILEASPEEIPEPIPEPLTGLVPTVAEETPAPAPGPTSRALPEQSAEPAPAWAPAHRRSRPRPRPGKAP